MQALFILDAWKYKKSINSVCVYMMERNFGLIEKF